MECKSIRFDSFCCSSIELIDTLWNVNEFLQKNSHGLKIELIDTLWNVNSA